MYRKGWRYRRNSMLLWSVFILLLVTAGYALRYPVYWIAVLALWIVRQPLRRAFTTTHPFRQLGWMDKSHFEFRDITFQSRDGLTLFGRFLRSKNQATILVLHPLHLSSSKMLLYAEFLASAGYGVFMIDLRAHGSSDGDTSTRGLREAEDVAGAVDYLLHRLDVNGQKIGVLGIDLGAEAAIQGGLKTDWLRAFVLEGLRPVTLHDWRQVPNSMQHWVRYPLDWLYYRASEFMIGAKNKSVSEAISKLGARPILLIASGKEEIAFNRHLLAGNKLAELWELPEAEHGDAVLQDSSAYMQKVVAFFNKALV